MAYHRPLLLDAPDARQALLVWFDSVDSLRLMPWRKPWIDPCTWEDADALRVALQRRAYEVWISEIMLQQTRVSVVIDYWKQWMAKWPNIQDLAGAAPDDVLSAWRGLGYYSRASRIHQAAQTVVKDPSLQGLLPAEATELKAKVAGIGPYTAGAISAIVFGHGEPMVDGNVIRVLSRQMGVFADFKTSKSATDMIWDAARALAKAISLGPTNGEPGTTALQTSDRPGRWGQALMELGSTVCKPKPDCIKCPITSTCRAFAEGMMLDSASNARERSPEPIRTPDMEDACVICQPMDETVAASHLVPGQPQRRTVNRPRKVISTANRLSGSSSSDDGKGPSSAPGDISQHTLDLAVDYARRFPVKGIKKAVRIEESVVCGIRCGDYFLISKRPSKGLLAGLWELPSYAIPKGSKITALSRKDIAQSYVSGLLKGPSSSLPKKKPRLKHLGELGSIPWLFSHIKLTMHVHVFELEQPGDTLPAPNASSQWTTSKEVEGFSMGTGMGKCWTMVKMSNVYQT